MQIKHKILLVDDEEVILKGCSLHLEQTGYDVSTASSGEKAIELLQDRLFHAVISDLVMPGIDGIEVIKEARNLYPNIGTIILTGYGDMHSAVKALRLGVDDYMLKPCNIEELLIRTERCLEKRHNLMLNQIYANTLPICVYCKSIRDDTGHPPGKGKWMLLEEYFSLRSEFEFSHTCCPDCGEIHNVNDDLLEY